MEPSSRLRGGRDKIRGRRVEQIQGHRSEVRRARYARDPTVSRAACQRYYQRNKAEVDARGTIWRRTNGQRSNALNIVSRGKRTGVEVDFSYLLSLVCPEKCPALGTRIAFGCGKDVPLESRASFDRIDSTKGYVRGNVQIISVMANTMKHRASQDQLHRFAQWILGA